MESCQPLPTPFPAKSVVVLDELFKAIENPDPVLNKQFKEIIGQLLYCQQQTVPEISWSVFILARFTTKVVKRARSDLWLRRRQLCSYQT